MQAAILSTHAARDGKTRVVFQCEDGADVFGPFVEHVAEGADVDAYVAAYATALADSLAAAELQANIDEVLNA